MNIDEMPAGREMDALVAEKVMGFISRKVHGYGYFLPEDEIPSEDSQVIIWPGRPVPNYSTDIAAAWRVIERVSTFDFGFSLFKYPGLSSYGYGYVAVFAKSLRPYSIEIVSLGDPSRVFYAHEDNLPVAICRAALRAVGE